MALDVAFLVFVCVFQATIIQTSGLSLKNSRSTLRMNFDTGLVIGVNKYSHDASCCIIDASNGKIIYAQAKERISGRKHDGGAINGLIYNGLNSVGAKLQDVKVVVSNNHHFRVAPYEKRVAFNHAMKYNVGEGHTDELNLLSSAKHYELSHHLAHAWSVIGLTPFEEGIILVMDGMGESYKAMIEDTRGIEENSGDYMHDLKLIKAFGAEEFIGQPLALNPGSGYREAESAYIFNKSSIRPIFKRWSRERSPPELYNHGFENMESLGKHLEFILFRIRL